MYSAVLVVAMTVGGQSMECKPRGCCGQTYGCSAYSGGCYGGGYGGGCSRGGHGGGCYRGCAGGYYGCTGCATPVIIGQVQPATMAPATVTVTLPTDARLSFNNAPTSTTGAQRSFQTPALPYGQSYSYTLRAETMSNGEPIVETRVVTVRAGETATVQFNPVQSGITSR